MAGKTQPQVVPFSPETLRLSEIRARVDSLGGTDKLDDQDKLEIAAHALLPTIVQSQAVGKIPKEQEPWDVALEVATHKFRQHYGRAPVPKPEPEAGPRPPTAAEVQLQRHRESVNRVVIPTFTGTTTVDVPKNPRQRAPTRQATGALVRDLPAAVRKLPAASRYLPPQALPGTEKVLVPLASVGKDVARSFAGGARGYGAMAVTTALLIPANILGFVSDEELQNWSGALAGQKTLRGRPKLAPPGESKFQQWYAGHAKRLGLSANPDDARHFYDYRAAFRAGANPDAEGHWPSRFKLPGHPRTIIAGMNTVTGQPAGT